MIIMKKPKNLKEALKKKLSKKEFDFAPKAFDSFGNIAIIEIPKELEKKKKLICDTLLEIQPRFETICSIESNHEGKFRVQKVKVISGKKQLTAIYKESNCTFKIPLGKVFFSPRLGNERLRISKEIKQNETIGTWFSGVGPYPIIFAKNSKMKQAIAIELNPIAHKFAIENYELNKIEKKFGKDKIIFIKGDVKKEYNKFEKYFDRIAMPLPHTGYQFLKEAFFCIKPKGTIYFYEIVEKGNLELPIKQINEAAKQQKRKIKIIRKATVRQFSPSKEQVVFDIKLTN
jgi:tRNA (guanine37-N1)-methyltransferase